MAVYGLTSVGFVPRTMAILVEEMEAGFRAVFGASIKLGDKSIFGQIIRIFAERLTSLWELGEAIATSQDPDKAGGAALEAICLLTGTFRKAATYSAVILTLTGDPTTVVPSGNRAATASTEEEFATAVDSSAFAAAAAWVATTVYALEARVTNGAKVYECITAGTSAGSGGPTTTAADITDGTVHWIYLGEGTGATDVLAYATATGPTVGTAGDITTIVNQVSGWSSVRNLLDANLGRIVTPDSDLRLLRELELAAGGSSPVAALRAELVALADVVSVTVFYNNTDLTDADGIPPHSVESLVRGPESPTAAFDQTIFDALLAGVAAGIRTHGSGAFLVTGSATDEQGTAHVMKFTRPTEKTMYVIATIVKDADEYPTDGDTLIKTAIVDYGDLQDVGKNAVPSRLAASTFDVTGVLDAEILVYDDVIGTATAWLATTAYVATVGARSVVTNGGRSYICTTSGTSAGSGGPNGSGTAIVDGTAQWRYLGATFEISLRELAVYDSSRVGVTSVDGVA